jgi:hypothetical protein
MQVHIELNDPLEFYTNLDFISGRVILSLTRDENVSAIRVKLEGESRTFIMPQTRRPSLDPLGHNQRHTIPTENHKLLHKVSQVFPTQDPVAAPFMGLSYTLRAGQHEYPFRFEIPLNNDCSDPEFEKIHYKSRFSNFGLVEVEQLKYSHVKRILPPSLAEFPGKAEIKYFIKATVERPSRFRENMRSIIDFKFLPMEPARPLPTTIEVYARRPYMFSASPASHQAKSAETPTELSCMTPNGEIEARLPSGAILTCDEPLPLRIIVRKTGESFSSVFLMSLQAHLIGSTELKASGEVAMEVSTWVLMDLNELSIPIVTPKDEVGSEIEVDSQLWDTRPLPKTVAPSFHICNVTRRYSLGLRIGLGYGLPGEIQARYLSLAFVVFGTNKMQPQIITLPLRFETEVYSGISPPDTLLDAIASSSSPRRFSSSSPRRFSTSLANSPPIQLRRYDPAYPPQLTQHGQATDELPPSYQDAMAEDMPPPDDLTGEYTDDLYQAD